MINRSSYLIGFILLNFLAAQAQTLPELDIAVHSRNYHEICAQLDAYFKNEYTADETDCWDNKKVKYERWKWFMRDRVHTDGSFPDLRDQWKAQQQVLHENVQDRDDQPNWQFEGPDEVVDGGGYWGMGRVKHVAFHPTNPDILFVGTPDGGIWKTEDGGWTWTALGDGLPYLPVSIILIDPQHPDTMYISLGDKGGWWMWNLGVYKSTDGGQSWFTTGLDWTLADENVIYNMVMSPTDPQTILVASNKGIRRSTDGAVTWTTLQTGEYTDLKYRPNDDQTLYAAKHDYWGKSQLVKSSDGGETWIQTSDFTATYNDIRIIVAPTNPDWVALRFSTGKRFMLSKDGGITFEDKSELPEDAHLVFSQQDSNIVYTSGVVVHRSENQGATWTKITNWYNNGIETEVHADVHDIVHNPYNPEEIFFCNDGGLYRYHEPTETWLDHSSGLGIAQFYRIAISEGGTPKIAAGSQDNGGWLRLTSGTWKHTNGGDAMVQAIDPTNSNTIYTEYYGGNAIYRSDNNYFTDTEISDNLPDDPSGDWVTPFLLNPVNPKTFVVGFHDIFRSYDRGDHFHQVTQNLTGSIDNKLREVVISANDTNFMAATWGTRYFKSANGGQTWSSHFIPGAEDITRLAIHGANPPKVWATKGGYSAGKKVYRAINGGVTWVNISANLPNVPINCIVYDSLTNYLIVGTDIGVFYSDATTIHWKPYGEGIPAVYVLDLKIRQTTRKLYAGTHGRGVYSVDLEQIVKSNTPTSDTKALSLYPNPAKDRLSFKALNPTPLNGHIQILDPTGRVVLRQQIAAQNIQNQTLSLSGLADGIYIVQGFDQDRGLVLNEKIVVMHPK